MQKGFAQVYLLIVLLIIGILGGYYYYSQNFSNKYYLGAIPSPLSPTPQANKTDETANPDSIGTNWKTYTNTEFGFSVKYPSTLVVHEYQPNPLFSRVAFSTLNQGCDKDINLTIDKIKNNPPDLESKVISTQKITIGTNNTDMKINELQKDEVPFHQACIYNKQAKNEDFLTVTATIFHDGFYWRFSSEIRRDYQEVDSTLYKQILSTFKFVPASDSESQNSRDKTANWKTYTNETYKFSFKYPETAAIQEVSPVYLRISDKNNSTLPSILIFLSKNTEGLSRRDFFAKSVSSKIEDILPYINIQETTVGNVPALRIVQDQEYYKKQSTAYTNYLISTGGNIIEIVTNEYVGKKNGEFTEAVKSSDSSAFYQEILSTFKFLN